MTIKRLGILFAVLCGGMGAVGFVPRIQHSEPAGIELSLPPSIGEWQGRDTAVSKAERQQLGPETEFARKIYRNASGDEIFASIVLAGHDMNTSIHRPELCLPSQGWTITGSGTAAVPLDGAPNHVLRVTRLRNLSTILLGNGKPASIYCLDYYWFVGCRETTPSHAARMLIDIRDRLLKGYNQRWAYITVNAAITSGFKNGGLSEKQTDELIGAFIRQLVPKVQKPGVKIG